MSRENLTCEICVCKLISTCIFVFLRHVSSSYSTRTAAKSREQLHSCNFSVELKENGCNATRSTCSSAHFPHAIKHMMRATYHIMGTYVFHGEKGYM